MNLENLCMKCMNEANTNGVCSKCGFNQNTYQSPAHTLPLQSILAGKYIVGAPLGEGGFGITYMGYNINLGLKVAIKEYYPNGLVTRENNTTVHSYTGEKSEYFQKGKQRFLDEAKTLAKFMNKPGVVSVNDFFAENSTVYIVMEYIDGVTLKQYLAKMNGRLPSKQVFEMMQPVIKTLGEIHKTGTIHRDISPDNLMITNDGEVKLLDFGAARDFSESGDRSLSVMLKPGYAPEEQYRTRGKQGPWTDIYALCATMYKCITGIIPDESSQRMRKDELQPPSQFSMSITTQEEKVLLKGLAVIQEDRYHDVQELYDDLYPKSAEEKIIDTPVIKDVEKNDKVQPIKIEEPKNDKSTQSNTSRRKLIILTVLIAAVLLVGLFSWLVYSDNIEVVEDQGTSIIEQADATEETTVIEVEVYDESDVIVWTDENLEREIREILEIETDDILVSDVSSLTSLYISQFSDDEDKWIESIDDLKCFINLTRLTLYACDGITDITPLSNLTNLQTLDLTESNGITDITPLSNLTNLTTLDLSWCDGINLTSLSNLTNLTTLDLSWCDGITDITPLSNLTNLTTLDLSYCDSITDITPLSNLTNLTTLDFWSCNSITDITPLSNLTNLTMLGLSNLDEITDLTSLSNLTHLTTLGLSYCDSITDLTSLSNLTNLTILKLYNCNGITDITPLSNLTNLTTLTLYNCNGITDITPLSNLTNLKTLDLSWSDGINDIIPLSNLTNLTALYLKYCDSITDLTPLSNLTNLTTLDLSWCDGITDLTPLANLTNLTDLDLTDCTKIADYSPIDHVENVTK